jgi:CTP-dependent riboflavin kinase
MSEKSENNLSDQLPLLLYIANKVGLTSTDVLSTVEIAQGMSFSQQTASRKMQELEDQGLIKKEYSPEGLRIGLTDKGINILKENFKFMKKIFETPSLKKKQKNHRHGHFRNWRRKILCPDTEV